MKKILLTIFTMSIGLLAQAQLVGGTVYQINGTDNVSPRTFATLRSAVTYVNANGLSGTGQAILEFSSGYTNEAMASSIIINALPDASATLGLTIRPATGVSVSLTANLSGQPLIDLDNADYITIDGRAGGVGVGGAISLENTNTGATSQTSVVRLVNDAQFNKLSYLTFRSAISQGAICGTVFLSTSPSGSVGNTDNTINNNTFTFPSNYVIGTASANQVISRGTSARPNNNISILNNNFEYWGGSGAVYSSSGNGWKVNNNYFYSTQTLSASGAAILSVIYLSTTNSHTIDGNFIGGQTVNAGGSTMNIIASNIRLISVEGITTSSKSVIQNNIITNINVSTPSDNTVAEFRAIYGFGSQALDILNNTIGSVGTANSLVINKNATANSNCYLIQVGNTGVDASNIRENTIANLQFNELGNSGTNNFYGIYANAGTGGKIIDNNILTKISTTGALTAVALIHTNVLSEITSNHIGSQTVTGDIVIESTRTLPIYSIYADGDYGTKITGNEVGSFSIKTILSISGNPSFIGIYVGGSTAVATLKTVENNFVGGTVANSIQTILGGGTGSASIAVNGIYNSNGNIRNNVIRNLTSNEVGYTFGMHISGSLATVTQNNIIENLTVNGQSNRSYVAGIYNVSNIGSINGNIISGLKSSNAVALISSSMKHVIGITSGGTGALIGNRISNLEAIAAGATSVYGIVKTSSGPYNGNISVLKNRIYDLKSSNATAGASIGGIDLITYTTSTGSYTVANNVINVSQSGDISIFGILTEFWGPTTDPAIPINASYNTILLEGTASGSAISSIIYRTNNSPVDLKNNLLFNNRSGGSGIHSLYGATTTAPAWVSDYNFLATASGNTNVGNWSGMAQNFTAWKTSQSGQDVNSVNDMTLTPSTFFNMTSATNFFLKTKEPGKLKIAEKATPNSVTDDILGATRAATPTIGAFEEVAVLPVTFKDFTAKLNSNRVSLNWNVVGEVDILRYEVERMSNGTDFVKVATVGAGQLNSYSATDANPQLGSNYYRLSAINNDGTASYFTEIKEVKVASLSESTVVVYPNPLVGNTINIAMAAYSNGIYTYKLSDITGRLLQKGSFEHRGSSNTLNLKAAISKGIYVLQISNGREQFQVKLIKP